MTQAAHTDRIKLIKNRLEDSLEPLKLTIMDDSHLHVGHDGAKESGGGHFNIVVVSAQFQAKSAIERHRMIYLALGDAMGTEIHALSIDAKTPQEAAEQQNI